MKEVLVVSKSNVLARSIQTLDVTEAKVIEYCLSNIFYKEEVTVDSRYTVDIDAMARHFGMDRSQAYKDLKRIAISIRGKDIRFPEYAGTGLGVITSWVTSIYYNDELEQLELRFSQDIIPYISGKGVLANFTTYSLKEVADFKYIYSNRLYNLCKSYSHLGKYATNIIELRDFLSLSDGKYKLYADLKRVVQRSIDEINSKTSLTVELLERKVGGKTYHLVFTIANKQQQPEK